MNGAITEMDAFSIRAIDEMLIQAQNHLKENPGLTITLMIDGGIETTADQITKIETGPNSYSNVGPTVTLLRNQYGGTARRITIEKMRIRMIAHNDVPVVAPEGMSRAIEDIIGRLAPMIPDKQADELVAIYQDGKPRRADAEPVEHSQVLRRTAVGIEMRRRLTMDYVPHVEFRVFEDWARNIFGLPRLIPGVPVDDAIHNRN